MQGYDIKGIPEWYRLPFVPIQAAPKPDKNTITHWVPGDNFGDV